MVNFIQIKDTRLLKSTIKRYQPIDDARIAIYFSASRSKTDKEVFTFDSIQEQKEMLNFLDQLL
jgi:hypothetical protein